MYARHTCITNVMCQIPHGHIHGHTGHTSSIALALLSQSDIVASVTSTSLLNPMTRCYKSGVQIVEGSGQDVWVRKYINLIHVQFNDLTGVDGRAAVLEKAFKLLLE